VSATVTINIRGHQVYFKTLAHDAIDTLMLKDVQTGLVEVIGFPNSQLTIDYWFTWVLVNRP